MNEVGATVLYLPVAASARLILISKVKMDYVRSLAVACCSLLVACIIVRF